MCSVSFKVTAVVGRESGEAEWRRQKQARPGITKKNRILRRQSQKERKGSRKRKRGGGSFRESRDREPRSRCDE